MRISLQALWPESPPILSIDSSNANRHSGGMPISLFKRLLKTPAPKPQAKSRPRLEPEHITVRHERAHYRVALRRSERARRYTLRVSGSTGEVSLTMPTRASLAAALAFAEAHGGWIAARLEKIPRRIPFAPGENLPLRGVAHRIVHRQAPRGITTPATDGHGLPILAIYGDAAHVARRVRDFLMQQARKDIEAATIKYTNKLGLPARKISLKDTTSRWGSCSAAGRLNFSFRLIMAPPFVLDYLVAHEVAHLKEMNHSSRFWRVVANLCPHWREAEAWLKQHGASLHRYG